MADGKRARRSARAVAMDLLARREHSETELRTKLTARDFTSDEIDATLAGLARDGLLSNERFTEAFIAARTRRGQGPVRIRVELEARGIGAALIGAGLEDIDWFALAREARHRKFGPGAPADYAERARQARFLQYRGFTGEQIRSALDDAGDND